VHGKSRQCLAIPSPSEKKRSEHPARARNLAFVHHVLRAPKVPDLKLTAVRHRLARDITVVRIRIRPDSRATPVPSRQHFRFLIKGIPALGIGSAYQAPARVGAFLSVQLRSSAVPLTSSRD